MLANVLQKLPRWWPWAAGLAAIALATRGRRALGAKGGRVAKLTTAEIDARYGPLRPGADYTEGVGGRIVVRPAWVAARIVPVKLFDGKTVRLHKNVAASFAEAYEAAVKASGYHPASVQTFVPRHILWNAARPLSLHSYGIAVDFDPSLNPWGPKPGRLDRTPAFVREMQARGWEWGGHWPVKSRDSMHFQRTAR